MISLFYYHNNSSRLLIKNLLLQQNYLSNEWPAVVGAAADVTDTDGKSV